MLRIRDKKAESPVLFPLWSPMVSWPSKTLGEDSDPRKKLSQYSTELQNFLKIMCLGNKHLSGIICSTQ